MSDQLQQLKSENHTAESDFLDAVKYYLLDPLDTPEKFHRALTGLFESVTRYRRVLQKLREYLNLIRDSEPVIARQATIEKAIDSLNTRDAALERLHKRIARLASDQSGSEMHKLAIR